MGRDLDRDDQTSLPLVVASTLPRAVRQELAEGGISYADARGHIYLRAPGLYVYIDAPTALSAVPFDRPHEIGLVGIRAVQQLLAAPEREWTVTGLETEAGVSHGEAHRVVTTLERSGLVEVRGRGPAKRRRVRDVGALLDWLAAQPRVRRVYRRLACSLYARTPIDLATRASHRLDASATAHAFTSGLAATLLDGGPTSVPRSVLRVDPNRPLDEIADSLGAEVTERGANLMLWSDDGLVGTHARIRHGDTWLAPPVRVYLDLLSERRGADAAAHFREVTFGA